VRSTQPEFRFIVDYTVLFRAPIEKTSDKRQLAEGRPVGLSPLSGLFIDSADNGQNNKDRSPSTVNTTLATA
jgi:hypothetical protein